MSGTLGLRLEDELVTIRDGTADSAALTRVRALVATDGRIPAELHDGLFDDDPADDAAALLAILGVDDGFGAALAAAIRDHAGDVEIDLASLELPLGIPVADAVTCAAGPAPEVWPAVARALDVRVEAPLATAIRAAAGPAPVLWAAIAPAIGATDELPIAAAVRAAAGEMSSVWPAVSAAIRPVAVPGPEKAIPSSLGVAPRLPRAANSTWSLRGLALVAAAAMVSVAVWRWPDPTSAIAPQEIVASSMVFANTEDTQVVDLSYGEEVTVVQVEGDQGALILWVEDTEGGS